MYTIYILYFPCKFYRQLNPYFNLKYHIKWIYIFKHEPTFLNSISPIHISTNFISNFLQQFFTARAVFYPLIKCIQYTLLLIENYSQMIFYNNLQYSTIFDTIILVYNIHCWITAQFETSCRFMKLNVELSESSFPFHTNIIPLNQKCKQESLDKFMQNSTLIL